MTFCHNCGTQIPEDSAFCVKCGARLDMQSQKRICPNCNNEMASNMMFCDKCGTKYSEPEPSRSHIRSTPQPSYSSKHTKDPIANTRSLTVLTCICLILCWPVAIYGYICRTRALKATNQQEANDAIHKGTRACVIAISIMVLIFLIGANM